MKDLYQKTLERYLEARSEKSSEVTIDHYRRYLDSFLHFLRDNYPKIRSFDKLRREPHITAWLDKLANAQPPYTRNTRRAYIRHVRQFLEHIREWGWPKSPSGELIRAEDFP